MRSLSLEECSLISGGYLGLVLVALEVDMITMLPICALGAAMIILDLYTPLAAVAILVPAAT